MSKTIITLVSTTVILLLFGATQVAIFRILHLNLREFIKAILWISLACITAFILAEIWTFGPEKAAVSLLYLIATLAIPVVAYIRRGHDILDVKGLIDSVDYIIAEVDKNARSNRIRE